MEQTEVREYGNDLCDSRSRVSQSNDCESGENCQWSTFSEVGFLDFCPRGINEGRTGWTLDGVNDTQRGERI